MLDFFLKIGGDFSKVFQNLAYGSVKKKAAGLQNKALKELDTHVVTQELEKGPSSGGSRLLGGRGNFFGFLGFLGIILSQDFFQ